MLAHTCTSTAFCGTLPLVYCARFCHVSEVANHVCAMKGELAGSWYTEVDSLSLFLMLVLLPLVIFVLARVAV